MSSDKKEIDSIRKQSAWLLFAKIVGFVLNPLLPLLVVRFLTQENVGVYRESFQVITNLIVLLPMGFSMSAYYFLARDPERRNSTIFHILLFNFIAGGIGGLTLIFFPDLLGTVFSSQELARLSPLIGVIIWIWIFSSFLETIAIANQEAKKATGFIIFAQLSKTILLSAAVLIFATVDALLYAALIQGIIQSIILFRYIGQRFPGFFGAFDAEFFKEQAIYALPLGLAGLLFIMQTEMHSYFVGNRFSSADFAVYAYGRFEIPMLAMLAESVASILITRVSALQAVGDKEEIIRLTARAMQKLSLFYFPVYVFFMITAQTFITTLFTEKYAASVPIFMINLTILPFSILITDPIVRAYKELSRMLVAVRIFVLAILLTVLILGRESFGLVEMISAAVGAILLEKLINETIIIKRVGFGRRHLGLLKNVWKTAAASVFAGIVTFVFYTFTKSPIADQAAGIVKLAFGEASLDLLNTLSGLVVMACAGLVFFAVYALIAFKIGIIEDEEKQELRNAFVRFGLVKQGNTV